MANKLSTMSAQILSDHKAVKQAYIRKRQQRKYHLPVIGHFSDRSIEFKSILEAEAVTGIHYTLIFESCVGKIFKAKGVMFEFKKGNHYIKYKAYYINAQEKYTRRIGFNG